MPVPTASFTADFRDEYEDERQRSLRRRFLIYASLTAAVALVQVVVNAALMLMAYREVLGAGGWLTVLFHGLIAAGYIAAIAYVRRRMLDRSAMLRLVGRLFVVSNAAAMVVGVVVIDRVVDPAAVSQSDRLSMLLVATLMTVCLSHVIASLFIPWTPAEAAKPAMVVLVVAGAMVLALAELPIGLKLLIVALSPMVIVPGALICAWRHSRSRRRFVDRMLRLRYREFKRDLIDARRVHEQLFPSTVREGPVSFTYRYEPMRQIGGDFLYARSDPETGALTVAIIDVTGHGIPAALLVNRLHGELERELGERPDASPGELVAGINTYLYHTGAGHSLFATALVLRCDPAVDELRWCSAGHPPALLRTADGRVERLGSTTLVMGVTLDDDLFEAVERVTRLLPGDAVVAYTDGVIEARDRAGRLLGVSGLERVVAAARSPEQLDPARLIDAVESFRRGAPEDDTLLVTIERPVRAAARRPPAATEEPAAVSR